ncbi:hypothetical protein KQX54_019194 [Cotesia glomerata]|uniref:Uncharacterized protein n=1 Tax=Cotesia glomerata TaxID=32391 RepID=A0AAV7J0P8_COTGL|nr:hypothetical protein KQX54_019194 [Cotesia glomerata]
MVIGIKPPRIGKANRTKSKKNSPEKREQSSSQLRLLSKAQAYYIGCPVKADPLFGNEAIVASFLKPAPGNLSRGTRVECRRIIAFMGNKSSKHSSYVPRLVLAVWFLLPSLWTSKNRGEVLSSSRYCCSRDRNAAEGVAIGFASGYRPGSSLSPLAS